MSSTGPSGARGQTVIGQERAEAVEAGADLHNYRCCHEVGASHAEVLEALGAGADLFSYAYCREAGATHAEVL